MIGIAWDTETTGLPLHPEAPLQLQPRIIEFGSVLFDREGNILSRLSMLIDPGVQISDEITKITGITNEDLRGKPKFADVWPVIKEEFAKAELIAAHNLPFDKSLVEFDLRRIDLLETFQWPRHQLCTAQAYQEEWGKRPRLLQLYEHVFGVPLHQTHRADEDAEALVQIIIKEGLLNDYCRS